MIYDINGISCEVLGLDSYMARFDEMVLPEYKGKAEEYLLEELERQDDLFFATSIEVYVDEEKKTNGIGERFVFNNRLPEGCMQREVVIYDFVGCSYP